MVDDVKAHNESIASDYSNLVYDPVLASFIDPDRVFGQAAMFGEVGKPVDVLDLACGTGAQLLRLADQVEGRLVGVDISPGPIRIAQERLAAFGDRADVRCADLLETDAASLGQFDLIYNIGVIYATPPSVQRRILDLIGQCLRPGGVAVLSYHSGGASALRSVLHRILVAGLDGLNPADAVAAARVRSASLRKTLSAKPGTDLLLAALNAIDRQSDIVFYHEVFNPCFGAMQTSQITHDLAAYGLEFAWYLAAIGDEPSGSALDRSVAADIADLAEGQYRYALFARYLESGLQRVTNARLRWGSVLQRENPGQYPAEQNFIRADGTAGAMIRVPASMAMLDCLTEGALDWDELVKRTASALKCKRGKLSDEELTAMRTDLRILWRLGLLVPSCKIDR
jgi:SAM-dependent methyltransferase